MTSQSPSDRETKTRLLHPYDAVLLPNENWCYAFELPEGLQVEATRQVIEHNTDPWFNLTDCALF